MNAPVAAWKHWTAAWLPALVVLIALGVTGVVADLGQRLSKQQEGALRQDARSDVVRRLQRRVEDLGRLLDLASLAAENGAPLDVVQRKLDRSFPSKVKLRKMPAGEAGGIPADSVVIRRRLSSGDELVLEMRVGPLITEVARREGIDVTLLPGDRLGSANVDVISLIGQPYPVVVGARPSAQSFTPLGLVVWTFGILVALLLGGLTWLEARSRVDAEAVSDALERSHHQLEKAADEKERFLATLGHELRNPLSAQDAAVTMLARDDTLTARSRKALKVVRRQVRTMRRLVDDLLDIARFEHGTVKVERQPTSLVTLAEEAVEDQRESARKGSVSLSLLLDGDGPVLGDGVRLQQVITNLVRNAISHARSRVEVRVATIDDTVELLVIDDGPGVPAADREVIFRPYRRLSEARPGLGIGLSVVRRLVEAHDGRVDVIDAPTSGACFRVRLPAFGGALPRVESTPPATVDAPAALARVLIVEDQDDAREMLAELISGEGHEVRLAANGAEALALLDADVDLAFVDLDLPDVDGFTVAATARARGHVGRLVALTGYGQRSDRERAVAVGFDAHMTKPIPLDRLAEELGRAVSSA